MEPGVDAVQHRRFDSPERESYFRVIERANNHGE
jgi:hypothetical protein